MANSTIATPHASERTLQDDKVVPDCPAPAAEAIFAEVNSIELESGLPRPARQGLVENTVCDTATLQHDVERQASSSHSDGPSPAPAAPTTAAAPIKNSILWRLYTSHFLSTWNSRLFEAAVVYFLAAIFPDSLLPISVYAVTRNAAAIAFTVPAGRLLDSRRVSRLAVVRASIVAQRLAVAASCALFWVLLALGTGEAPRGVGGRRGQMGLFAASVVLACVEKVAAGMNLVAVERDWVVVITDGDEAARQSVNARMRRIDLFCKLLGPLVIALIAAASVSVAVYCTLAMNILSVLVEYFCIETVRCVSPQALCPTCHIHLLMPSPGLP